MKIRRASITEVRKKALPILMEGYEKRKSLRSSSEELLRSHEKVTRDRQSSGRPRISPI
jgi:hypothetical protein